ncbi:hypothetical protein GCM10028857_10850 [Salinarchaeum chitinilyticum]
MFGDGDDEAVTCIACGAELPRSAAREYDKQGDRWDREAKTFEYFCKSCDRDRSHQPRRGLEADLVASGAGECDDEEFLGRLCGQLEERATEEP